MFDKLFDDPETAFLVVATVITILILLLRLFLKSCVLLWKSSLISYVVFLILIFMGILYEHSYLGDNHFYRMGFDILSMILLTPSMLIYGILTMAKMCPSNMDVFAWHTIGYLFYTLVILGIMKVVKQRKEMKATAKKQDDSLEKQIPSTDSKGG